jgi:hypothetical protein
MPVTFLEHVLKVCAGCGAGSSRYATGVPGSLDRLLPYYGILLFSIGTLASWPASNNAAIFADVSWPFHHHFIATVNFWDHEKFF